MDTIPEMDKLNENNFTAWKLRMRAILVHKGLWDIANAKGQETLPTVNREEEAFLLILLSLNDQQLLHVTDCHTAGDLWVTICNIHEGSGLANKLLLMKQYHLAKMQPGEKMADHINTLKTIRQQLVNSEVKISDDEFILRLLSSLSPQYNGVVTSLESNTNQLTTTFVIARLLAEETKNNEQEQEQALMHRGNTTARTNAPKPHEKRIICFYCNKPGHIKRKCRKRIYDERNKREAAFLAGPASNPHWYIDSGASSHMTGDKDHFI